MENENKPPSAEELLNRIIELQERHVHIKQKISKLMISGNHRPKRDHQTARSHLLATGGVVHPLANKLTESQCFNILQSMGQAMHVYDFKHQIFFWNRAAEKTFGYTPDEAYGKTPLELITEPKDAAYGVHVLDRTLNGESWCGGFPVVNKSGGKFVAIATSTPYYDENGRLLGAMCLSSNTRLYNSIEVDRGPTRITFDSQQTSIASKLSNLALNLKSKRRTCESLTGHVDVFAPDHSNETLITTTCTLRGHITASLFGVFYFKDIEKHFISRQQLTIDCGKERIVWPWKENGKLDCQPCENTNSGGSYKTDASGMSLLKSKSKSSISSSTGSGVTNLQSHEIIEVKGERKTMGYEILWEDLIIKESIGQGSSAIVYHALWYGSDVAVKLLLQQEYYDDVIIHFKKEVSFVKRLRHPNILLFMGAVTSRQHLCIVTEFLPRGSLYRMLQRDSIRLDWRRRIRMAMDIAQGMNYLHRFNPPILHLDLKSSNLLVDKNWTVKVGDFGLSRNKDHTYSNVKADKGTPQWMAPEILRNEHADEKSDVYSYGVVLWELTTLKIPWDNFNPAQVIEAVGFSNQRLEIPKDVDPLWASLIESCWYSESQLRPTFQEILYKLKILQKKFAVERKR
ncbi:serine/threonine-protein kinase STY46-like isoform X2 [Rutidosis leptorrhynchoides]